MNAPLNVESSMRASVCVLKLDGTIDERFDPNLILSSARGRQLIFDLAGITRLTSFGIREWAHLMRKLDESSDQIFFADCSPAIVTQLNMVANFAGSARLVSVRAPFYCDQCGAEESAHIDLSAGAPDDVPLLHCKACGAPEMEFDEDPDSYFIFPKNNLSGEIPPAVLTALSQALQPEAMVDGPNAFNVPDPTSLGAEGSHASAIPLPNIPAQPAPAPSFNGPAAGPSWMQRNRWNVVLGGTIVLALALASVTLYTILG